jgi:hypothetical protein
MGAEMNCPKCGTPAEDQAAYCGLCYEVLRKPPAAASAPAARPAETPKKNWTPASIAAAFLLFAVLAVYRDAVRDALWFVHLIDLPFHEGGHIVFRILGLGNRFIMVCGGTAMQLIIPAAAAAHFYRRRERASVCVALWWFGENLLGIGNYIADARAQQLHLVAGGVHDWTYLLETVGLLIRDEGIGRAVSILGCLVMAVSAVAVYVYRRAESTPE